MDRGDSVDNFALALSLFWDISGMSKKLFFAIVGIFAYGINISYAQFMPNCSKYTSVNECESILCGWRYDIGLCLPRSTPACYRAKTPEACRNAPCEWRPVYNSSQLPGNCIFVKNSRRQFGSRQFITRIQKLSTTHNIIPANNTQHAVSVPAAQQGTTPWINSQIPSVNGFNPATMMRQTRDTAPIAPIAPVRAMMDRF